MNNPHLNHDDTIYRCSSCGDRIADETTAARTVDNECLCPACVEPNDDPLARPLYRVNFRDSLARRIREAV